MLEQLNFELHILGRYNRRCLMAWALRFPGRILLRAFFGILGMLFSDRPSTSHIRVSLQELEKGARPWKGSITRPFLWHRTSAPKGNGKGMMLARTLTRHSRRSIIAPSRAPADGHFHGRNMLVQRMNTSCVVRVATLMRLL